MKISKNQLYSTLSTGTSVLTAILIRKGLNAAWKKIYSTEPPENPGEKRTEMKEAILWTLASGITISLGKLLTNYALASQWKEVEGSKPPRA